ncbi:MAG: hypothetical protein IJ174_08840 [Clostridia bacterium]|nr:hypothetical protein [Clostridia bacterium]
MKRAKYTEQMNELHVPKDRAEKTLQMMLEENRRLAKEEAEGHAETRKGFLESPFFRRSGYVLAAVACLVLMFFGVRMLGSGASFHSIRTSSLPSLGGARGGAAEAPAFEEVFGRAAGDVFPGWTVLEENTEAIETKNGTLYVGTIVLRKDGKTLDASVTSFEPPLVALLKSEGLKTIKGMYLAKDDTEQPSTLYAACEKDGLHIVFSGQGMDENAFLNAVETMK